MHGGLYANDLVSFEAASKHVNICIFTQKVSLCNASIEFLVLNSLVSIASTI